MEKGQRQIQMGQRLKTETFPESFQRGQVATTLLECGILKSSTLALFLSSGCKASVFSQLLWW